MKYFALPSPWAFRIILLIELLGTSFLTAATAFGISASDIVAGGEYILLLSLPLFLISAAVSIYLYHYPRRSQLHAKIILLLLGWPIVTVGAIVFGYLWEARIIHF